MFAILAEQAATSDEIRAQTRDVLERIGIELEMMCENAQLLSNLRERIKRL